MPGGVVAPPLDAPIAPSVPEAVEPSRNTIPSGPPSIPAAAAPPALEPPPALDPPPALEPAEPVELDKSVAGATAQGRASVPASLLIPRPAPGSAPSDARVGQIEVQLQATRAALSRASDDVLAAQRRAEAAEAATATLAAAVQRLEAQLTEARASLEREVRGALERAERPVALDPLIERLDKLEHGMGQARASQATAQHELAEHARLFESRKARLESVEARVHRLESDARFTDLHRAVERIDLRLSALEKRAAPASGDAASVDLSPLLQRLDALEKAASPASRSTSAGAEGLRQIKGIGPKYEKQLRELGITEPAQIAAWTEADLADVAEKLGVPLKRLEKLGWIEAARAVL